MKKKVLAILASVLLVSGFSACEAKGEGKSDNHSLINYTDTGENSSNISSKTAEFDHSSTDENGSASEAGSSESEDKSESKINNASSSDSSSKNSETTSTVNIITYYYNTVSDENPDTSSSYADSDETSSQASSSEAGSDVDSQTDFNKTDTDTETFSSEVTSSEPIAGGSYSEEDFALIAEGGKIRLGDGYDSVIELIGEPISSDTKTDSAGLSELQKQYCYYEDFWIKFTDSADSSELTVEAIQIFTDSLETEKGIKIGMTFEDVIRTYGNSSTVVNGEYRYYMENQYMYFDVQNGIVADIGYRIDPNVDNEAG